MDAPIELFGPPGALVTAVKVFPRQQGMDRVVVHVRGRLAGVLEVPEGEGSELAQVLIPTTEGDDGQVRPVEP